MKEAMALQSSLLSLAICREATSDHGPARISAPSIAIHYLIKLAPTSVVERPYHAANRFRRSLAILVVRRWRSLTNLKYFGIGPRVAPATKFLH